jgi:trehalose 6-phosphate phosphatase
LDSPRAAGVFVDFDGTLAPIVDDPDQARALPGAAELLARLAERYGRVVVVSGRPLAYLAEHLGPAAGATEMVGLYGLERSTAAGDRSVIDSGAASWRPAVEGVARRADAAVPVGVHVERKGLAVTLHFRDAPELGPWVERFAAAEAGRSGLAAHPGKMSWELRPPVRTDKGTVVTELAGGLGAVCYVGDDRGDLPAFEALVRLAGHGVRTLAVAVGGPETPPELMAAADLIVADPAAVLAFLSILDRPAD